MLIPSLLMAGLFLRGEVEVQSTPALVRVNGVEMAWSPCASSLPPSRLEQALRGRWQRAAAPVGVDGWWVLRHRAGTVLYTLQLRPTGGGGSSGYCSALDAASHPHAPARPALVLPGAAAVHSIIEQGDAGLRSVQFIGRVAGDPAAWRRQVLRAAEAGGWRALAGLQLSANPEMPTSLVRAGLQVDVAILRAGGGWQFLLNQHPASTGAP